MPMDSYCLDCAAEFGRPLVLEVDGKAWAYCPKCKGDRIRLKIPEPPGMSAKFKIKVEVTEIESDD
jgi:hypothetical protein